MPSPNRYQPRGIRNQGISFSEIHTVFVHYFSSLIYSLPEFGDVSYLREKIKEQEELHTSKFIVLSEHRNPLQKLGP
jgi:hypothetical protein